MHICVLGAGSVGGYLAVKLALAGSRVTVVARGAHLAAIQQQQGIRLVDSSGDPPTDVTATGITGVARLQDVKPPIDIILLAVKAHQILPVADELVAVLGPSTVLIPLQNGIPFWYFHKHTPDPQLEGRIVRAVDPTGELFTKIPVANLIGCVVYVASELVSPGCIRHVESDRFPVGELDGSVTERVTRVSELFQAAGLKSPVLENIRSEIWLKLWGNMTFNPISALTHGTITDICEHDKSLALCREMMREAEQVAKKLGITFRLPVEKRLDGAYKKAGSHKTSMLQDVEGGRPLEVEALLGVVIELAKFVGVPTPQSVAVYACTSLLSKIIEQKKVKVVEAPVG